MNLQCTLKANARKQHKRSGHALTQSPLHLLDSGEYVGHFLSINVRKTAIGPRPAFSFGPQPPRFGFGSTSGSKVRTAVTLMTLCCCTVHRQCHIAACQGANPRKRFKVFHGLGLICWESFHGVAGAQTWPHHMQLSIAYISQTPISWKAPLHIARKGSHPKHI